MLILIIQTVVAEYLGICCAVKEFFRLVCVSKHQHENKCSPVFSGTPCVVYVMVPTWWNPV